MTFHLRFASPFLTISLLALAAAFPAAARAANEGQADLDKATELKLGAQSTGDLTEVIQLCESALKKGLDKSNTTFANDLMSSALMQRGALAAAKIFGDSTTAPSERLNLENAKWKTYRDDALADLEKALKLNPKQPQAYFVVAKLNLLPGGSVEKAIQALDKTVALADDEATLRADALLLRSSLRKNIEQRIADLNEAVKTLPNNAVLLRARGLALAQHQEMDKALADFDKSIAVDPNTVTTYELKAAILVQLKRYADAQTALEKARTLAPSDIELPVAKAKIYVAEANYKAAAAELTRALAINGSNLGVLELRMAVYDQMGEKAKALADAEKLLELKPDNLDFIRQRAALLADLGKFDKAVEALDKLHKANPKDSLTSLQIGMLYTTMKQYSKALAAYDEVLARNPDDVAALRGRGDALLNTGRRSDAAAEYEKAVKLQPHDVGILNNYAWLLATAPEEKLRNGRRALEMAIEACKQTDYKRDYILSTLAAAYAETGDFASARKYAAQAVEVAPVSKDEPDRKEELKKELDTYKANKPWREALIDGVNLNPADKKTEPQKSDSKATAGNSASKKDPTKSDKPKKKKKKKKPLPPPEDDV